MEMLTIQIESPRHVAWTVRGGLVDQNPLNTSVMLLYAVHRLLRITCGCCRGFGTAKMGRIDGMADSLLAMSATDGMPAQLAGIIGQTVVSNSLKALSVTAASLLTPDMVASKTQREWGDVADGLKIVVNGLLPLAIAIRTAAGDGKGFLHVAAGPDGCAVIRVPGNTESGTMILLPEGAAVSEYGPALLPRNAAGLPEPLIPWPGEGSTWETIDGVAVDAEGRSSGPTGVVNAEKALGRMLAWADAWNWDIANRLSRIGPGETAAEYLLVATDGSDEWRSPDSIRRLIEFVNEHGDITPQFLAYALAAGDRIEAAAGAAGDFATVIEALIIRQQLQTGSDKARSLRKLANIYLEKQNDKMAAQLCMIKALEASPGDADILSALLDLTGEIDDKSTDQGLAEVAVGLLRAGYAMEGAADEAAVLNSAATLLEKVGDMAAADRAHARLLDIDPNAVPHFERLVGRLAGPQEVLAECTRRLSKAWKSEARGRYLLYMAAALRDLGRTAEAASSMKEAAVLLPETVELLDAMRDTLFDAGDWPALIGLLKRRAAISGSQEAVRAAALEIADIALERMNSPVIALGALEHMGEGTDPEVRRRMFQIHSSLDMWNEAAADMGVICAATGRPQDLTALARIFRDRLGKPAEAATRFKAALERLDGREFASVAIELADIPGQIDGDGTVTAILRKAVEAADDDLIKAGILKRLGCAGDSSGAAAPVSASHLEEALALNPLDHECAIKLADIYLAGDMAEKAVSVLEPPARAAASAGDTELEARLRSMAAAAATRCFDHAGAARHLSRLLTLRPGDVDVARRLARAELSLGNIDRAVDLLESLSEARGTAVPADAPLLRDLAGTLAARGDFAGALKRLEQAWNLDSDSSEDILRELADTASAAGDTDAMITWLKRLVHTEAKSPRRFTDLIRLGDAVRARGEIDSALEWYMAASAQDYSKKVALHKALEVSLEGGHTARAATLLGALTDEEPDDLKKSDYHLAAAVLHRDNLNDDQSAIDHLKKALGFNPLNEQAGGALDDLLTKHGQFDELTESLQLRARQFRMAGAEHLLLDALRKLAGVYESDLHNNVKAAEVFKQILTVDPADAAALSHLAFCLARIPGAEAEALDAIRKVIATDPTAIESYRSLRDLAILTSSNDLATRASTALIVLGHGDESDFHLAAKNRSAALHLKTDQIPAEVFNRRLANDLDHQMARIFSLLFLPVMKIVPVRRPGDVGLNDADRINMIEGGLFQNMADAVARVFNIELPVFWYAKGSKGMKKAPFLEKGLVVGDDLVATRRGKDLRYSLSRAVVSFMPGAELCGILDANAMRLFFLAALKLVYPEYVLPPDAATAADFVPGLAKHLDDAARAEIRKILANFSKAQRPLDIPGYLHAIDRIAGRAGLFMANDLEVAAARSLESDLALSDMEPEERIVELCSWAVSADYTELKKVMIVQE